MRPSRVLAGVAIAALATGCGSDGSPADAVPALAQQLDRVDAAIDSGRYGAARSALDDLAAETEQARADGTLDADEADAILTAVAGLDGRLPRPTPTPSSDPSSDPSSEPEEAQTEAPPPAAKPHPKKPEKQKPHHAKPHKKPHKKPHHAKPPKKPKHGH